MADKGTAHAEPRPPAPATLVWAWIVEFVAVGALGVTAIATMIGLAVVTLRDDVPWGVALGGYVIVAVFQAIMALPIVATLLLTSVARNGYAVAHNTALMAMRLGLFAPFDAKAVWGSGDSRLLSAALKANS